MQTSGPVALTLGSPTAVTAPSSAGIGFVAITLSNHSPMACAVDIGGPTKWLQPWTTDLYQLPPGDSVNVTPKFTDQTGATTGNLTAEWYGPTDPVVGTYPAPLFSEAITAAISGGSITSNPPLVGVLQQYNNTIPGAATTIFGPFDVRNVGALGLQYQVGTNGAVAHPCQWEMDWAATSGGSPVYSEIWQMDAPTALAPSAPGLLDVFAPLAGFVTLKVTPSAGAPLLNLLLWAMPLGAAFERPSPQVMIALTETIAGNGTFNSWPGLGGTTAFQIPGKAVSSLRASQAPNLASFGFFTGSGYQEFAAFGKASSPSPAFDPTIAQVNIPRSTVELVIFNGTATSGTFLFNLTSSRD